MGVSTGGDLESRMVALRALSSPIVMRQRVTHCEAKDDEATLRCKIMSLLTAHKGADIDQDMSRGAVPKAVR